MTTNKTYNGWTNYETWNIALHMDNEQGSQEYWNEKAEEILDESEADNVFTKEENAALTLADIIKDEFMEGMPDVQGCYADLLIAAISEVNWHEIAENLIKEAGE